jgi:hypothetical protein
VGHQSHSANFRPTNQQHPNGLQVHYFAKLPAWKESVDLICRCVTWLVLIGRFATSFTHGRHQCCKTILDLYGIAFPPRVPHSRPRKLWALEGAGEHVRVAASATAALPVAFVSSWHRFELRAYLVLRAPKKNYPRPISFAEGRAIMPRCANVF